MTKKVKCPECEALKVERDDLLEEAEELTRLLDIQSARLIEAQDNFRLATLTLLASHGVDGALDYIRQLHGSNT